MKKILIIDADHDVQGEIAKFLKTEGCKIISADNGHVGIQLAQEHSPDLIICDLMSQEFDGFNVLSTLRQDERTAMLPFIFLTTKGHPADLRKGMNLGADDYLTKPFNPLVLQEAIDARLKKHEITLQPYISERNKCEELQVRNQELKHSTQIKDDMLEAFSQKLRESVSAINMAAQMIKRASSELQQDNYLKILHQECDRIVELVNQQSSLEKILMPENIRLLNEFNLLKKR